MLCTMCTHGVTAAVDGKPTGAVWQCRCGERSCRHIDKCDKCAKPRSASKTLIVMLALEVYYEQAAVTADKLAEVLDAAMRRGLTEDDRVLLGQPHINLIHVPDPVGPSPLDALLAFVQAKAEAGRILWEDDAPVFFGLLETLRNPQ